LLKNVFYWNAKRDLTLRRGHHSDVGFRAGNLTLAGAGAQLQNVTTFARSCDLAASEQEEDARRVQERKGSDAL
jgi:hypothetical protein